MPSATNEQKVVALDDELEQLKQDYHAKLTPIAISVHEGRGDPTLAELLQCQNLGNAYFNAAERFVGNSGVLGAHLHGKWVTGLAETCHAILTAYIVHIKFLRSHNSTFGGTSIEPSDFAYANMQRMVKEYLPKNKATELMELFLKNNLPIQGFTLPAAKDQTVVTKWQRVVSVVVGVIAVGAVLTISMLEPNPTPWQQYVLRGCLAIGLAALGSLVPGFLNVTLRMKSYLTIMAGGSLAIFVLLWMITPKTIPNDAPPQAISVVRP